MDGTTFYGFLPTLMYHVVYGRLHVHIGGVVESMV